MSSSSTVLQPPRLLRKRSLVYGVVEETAGSQKPTAGRRVDLERSPELCDLYAVLMLGSRDISAEEIAIYDAFVDARVAAAQRLLAGTSSRDTSSDSTITRSESSSEYKSNVSSGWKKRMPILICADGSVVNTAVALLEEFKKQGKKQSSSSTAPTPDGTHLNAGESDPSSVSHPFLSTLSLSLAFDALCGDFDSVPFELFEALGGNGGVGRRLNQVAEKEKEKEDASQKSTAVVSGSGRGKKARLAEYYHVTALYESDCQFSHSVSDQVVGAALLEAERPRRDSSDTMKHLVVASDGSPSFSDASLSSFISSPPLPFSSIHKEEREGPAAASLSKALNRRQKGVSALSSLPLQETTTIKHDGGGKGMLGGEEEEGGDDMGGEGGPLAIPPAVIVKVDCQMTTDFEKCCQLLEVNHLITSAAAEEEEKGEISVLRREGAKLIEKLTVDAATRTTTNNESQIASENAALSASRLALPKVLVLGALGGRMDHEFAVFNTLFHSASRLDLTVYNGRNTLFTVPSNTVMLYTLDPQVDVNTIGVVVFGNATNAVVTKGLKWDLGPELRCGFGFVQSTSNAIEGLQSVVFAVHDNEKEGYGDCVKEQRQLPTMSGLLALSLGDSTHSGDDSKNSAATDSTYWTTCSQKCSDDDSQPLSADDIQNSFVLDTRGCDPQTFVLVTVPRKEDKRK